MEGGGRHGVAEGALAGQARLLGAAQQSPEGPQAHLKDRRLERRDSPLGGRSK